MVKTYYSNLPLLWILLVLLPLITGKFGFIFLFVFLSPVLRYFSLIKTQYEVTQQGFRIHNLKGIHFISNADIEGIYQEQANFKKKLLTALPSYHYVIILKNGLEIPVAPRKDLCYDGERVIWCS